MKEGKCSTIMFNIITATNITLCYFTNIKLCLLNFIFFLWPSGKCSMTLDWATVQGLGTSSLKCCSIK